MLEKFFKLSQNKTTVTTEVIAGFTTFFTMAYIIFVNPSYLSGSVVGIETGLPFNGAMVATCLSAAIGTLLIGLMSNYPFAQAPGMGLNAFFLFTMVLGVGLTWQSSMAIIFIAGILFILITASGLRKKIFTAVPKSLKYAITAGIGLFIASLGIKNSGIISVSESGLFLGSFSNPTVLLALGCLFLMIILMAAKVKGSVLIGILVTSIIATFVPNAEGTGTISQFPTNLSWDATVAIVCYVIMIAAVIILGITQMKSFVMVAIAAAVGLVAMLVVMLFSGQSDISLAGVAFQLDFGGMFGGENVASVATGIITFLTLLISLTMIDMFDTMGMLIGTGEKAGFLDKDGNLPRMDQALYADAIATSTGALLGTSTVTTYAESVAGVNVGGRTGLTSVVVAGLFIASLVFTPIAGMIPAAATSPALIVVGVLMMGAVRKIDWDDFTEAAPAFITILVMPFATSITDGIGMGFITYCVCKIVSGNAKKVSGLMYGLAGIFILYYVLKATVLGA